jgi:hypothetical protein
MKESNMLTLTRFSIFLSIALLGAFSIAKAQTPQSDNRGARPGAAERIYQAVGRVVDAATGKPIVGSTAICVRTELAEAAAYALWLNFGVSAKTDEQGNFRLTGLTPGKYLLGIADCDLLDPSLTGCGDHYSDEAQFEIQSADVVGLEIRAKRGSTISGVAVIEDADSSAKQRLSQVLILALDAPPHFSKIGSDGGFIVKGIRPGNAELRAVGVTEGLKIALIERGGVEISDRFVVKEGEDITGVRIIFGKGSGVIRGQLKMTGGKLPERVRIIAHARREKGPGVELYQGNSGGAGDVDDKGRFVIEGLAPGEYVLSLVISGLPGRQPTSPDQKVTVAKGKETQVTMTLDLSKYLSK